MVAGIAVFVAAACHKSAETGSSKSTFRKMALLMVTTIAPFPFNNSAFYVVILVDTVTFVLAFFSAASLVALQGVQLFPATPVLCLFVIAPGDFPVLVSQDDDVRLLARLRRENNRRCLVHDDLLFRSLLADNNRRRWRVRGCIVLNFSSISLDFVMMMVVVMMIVVRVSLFDYSAFDPEFSFLSITRFISAFFELLNALFETRLRLRRIIPGVSALPSAW